MTPVEIIRAHIPDLTEEDEKAIEDAVAWGDVADYATRTCACGLHIDGFYDYVDHLIAALEGRL